MSDLKIFVSSTCYDLGPIRDQLRTFLQDLGHVPVMSEYSDVLFDPRLHTHTACLKEIENCDLCIVIAGGRFGGKAVPEAADDVDLDKVKQTGDVGWLATNKGQLSITQLEVLTAVQEKIPIFAFVPADVYHDHHVWESNKSAAHVDQIVFPSIEKQPTAKYIFEFINFLRHRTQGNAIQTFLRFDDIADHLRRQWSALFQRLLSEVRFGEQQNLIATQLSEQLDALKTAVMSTLQPGQVRDVARGVVKFRRLMDFIAALQLADVQETIDRGGTFRQLLNAAQISRATYITRAPPGLERAFRRPSVLLYKVDASVLEYRGGFESFAALQTSWAEYTRLPKTSRDAILEAWSENSTGFGPLMLRRGEHAFLVGATEEEINLDTPPTREP